MKLLIRQHKWIIFLATLVVLTLSFGIYGYYSLGQEKLDPIYNSIKLLSFVFPAVNASNWQLELAKFFAFLFAISASIKIALYFLEDNVFKPYRLSKNSEHIVIFGFNGHIETLVKNINKEDLETKVVLVASSKIDTIKLGLNATTIVSSSHLNKIFMSMLNLEKAKHIVCMDMNDSTDVTNANNIIKYLNKIPNTNNIVLHIHINSYTLPDLFNHENYISAHKTIPCDIKVFNHYDNAVKILFRQEAMEVFLDKKITHWLIVGEWDQQISFMRYVAQMAYYEDEALPSITLFCKDAIKSEKMIQNLFPKIDKTATINIIDFVSSSLENTISNIAVLYEDDVKGLEESLILNNTIKNVPIFLQQREKSIINNNQIITFGLFNSLNGTDIIFDEVLDKRAKNIHNYYRSKWEMEPWEELSLFKKNSNRMQAEHISIKLRAIGWKNENDFTGYQEFLDKNPKIVQKLAKIEHSRWNAFHYVNGWDYAKKRDDSKKLHNCLVDFGKLSKDEQKKDKDALEKIVDFVKDS